MLKNYMHKKERLFVEMNDNRVVRPFGWGMEHVGGTGNDDPRAFFAKYSSEAVRGSDNFYNLSNDAGRNLKINGSELSWDSAILSGDASNNRAFAHLFKFEKNKRSAVVVLPHWNAKAGTYFDLCRLFNKVGLTALRLTLPYHEARMPSHLERADHLVAPNIGLTLQSVRQAVLDTRSAVRFLKEEGYENIGIVGTSIGSCTAFLAMVHEPDIKAAVFNHVSSYFADVVWKGLSTYHVRAALEKEVSLEELRDFWRPISPAAFMSKLAGQEYRRQCYIYTLYDLTFPVELSRQTVSMLKENGIPHSKMVLPCGHYTLGEKPWVYLDGYRIVSFLRKNLK